jgi:micrococcal nuclease
MTSLTGDKTRALGVTACLLLAAGTSSAASFRGVARMIDGDTIAIGSTRFRLNGVADPERDEPGGGAATEWMRRHLAGRTVMCKPKEERIYSRIVAICYVNGQGIGAAIMRAGFARHCPRYSGGRYRDHERAARLKGLDLSRRYPLP